MHWASLRKLASVNVKIVEVQKQRAPGRILPLQGLDFTQTGVQVVAAMPSHLLGGSSSASVQIGQASTIRYIPEDVERDGDAGGPAAPLEPAGALRRQSDSFGRYRDSLP